MQHLYSKRALQQKGSLKGRFIFEHLWDAFGSWSAMDSGAFTFVDFSKAFHSVSHAFARAFFGLLHLPSEYVNILLMLLKAPIALIIHGGVHLSSVIRPTSGVRQGSRLSLTIFAMPISPIVTKLQTLSLDITILPVQKWYKYLGVKLGNVSPSEAYNPALQKPLSKAYAMQN